MNASRRPGLTVDELLGSAALGTGEVLRGRASTYSKAVATARPYEVANEYVCNRLALLLGLTAPLGDIGTMPDGGLAWVTFAMLQGGDTTAPPDLLGEVAVREPAFAAGTLVFDEWVLNIDRTDENIVWFPGMSPYLIDHGEAFLSGGMGGMLSAITTPTSVTASHPFRETVGPGPHTEWVQRVQMLSREAIRAPLRQARAWGLITADEQATADKLLHERRSQLKSILARRGAEARPAQLGIEIDGGDEQ